MKCCIAVLTRGYSDINKYSMLISRNKHILQNLNNKSIDMLFFHENNIIEEQQLYIKNQTPELNIIFINILNNSFKKEKEEIHHEEAVIYNIKYRHMCSFWFVDFWENVKEYDMLLRIDEDCDIKFNIDNIFNKFNNSCLFVTGQMANDDACVTIGLNDLSLDFINKNSNYIFKNYDRKIPSGPYTNLFGIYLSKIRENDMCMKYIKEIELSEMIYKRRWGDLPLWGDLIYYIYGNEVLNIDNTLKYYHGSHNINII